MSPSQSSPPPASSAASPWPGRPSPPLVRVALALVLIVGSGGVRSWQARRVDAALARGREAPFSLETVPLTLGSWVGTPTDLDARIVEATGSTDHVTRRYIDQRTGVALDVIILYGPTSDIFIHAPELCYPKAGFAAAGETFERPIRCRGTTVPFRSLAYAKGEPGQVDRQEVFYAWRYNGRWSTTVSSPKESERIPGMYKVQLARRILRGETRDKDNPCEAFLEVLIPDLEARIAGQAPPPALAAPKA